MNMKPKKNDLHIHTIFSDGSLTPFDVVRLASQKGLYSISITDHDTIEGIKSAMDNGRVFDIIVIPGIEISCQFHNEEIHLLGYFIDFQNQELLQTLNMFRESRESRGKKIVEKLNSLGINISLKEVVKIAGNGVIGRPHIAKALVNNNYVESIQEAFDKYLNNNKPAYVDRYKLSLKQGIELIHNAGGAAVFAHPGLVKNNDSIIEAIKYGIDGIEVIHSKHTTKDVLKYTKIAKKNNLVITGGSDFHGDLSDNAPIIGDFFIDYSHVELLFNRAVLYKERRNIKNV